MKSLALAEEVNEYVIEIRRDLHENPEVSMKEKRSIQIVTNELKEMNIAYEVVPHGGIIGVIEGERKGRSLILRADLDALPMTESDQNLNQDKLVVSKDRNAAHTCGHDGHTAMLLGAAKILSKNKHIIKGKVILAFEQGEEKGQGIYRLLRRLVEMGADGVWGIHLKSDIPSKKISVDPGPRMAGTFPFNIEIKGKSGHGSRPDLASSPIDCFNHFYNDLQAVKLTRLDPFKPITYSIGTLSAGTAPNVIPETLTFSGTARYLHHEQGVMFKEEFDKSLKKSCEYHNCTYEYVDPPMLMNLFVYNEETCVAIAEKAIIGALGEQAIINYPAWMASEPFAFYQTYFPGVFAFVGIENEAKGTGAEHHNPAFDIDEDVLKLGVAATVQYAIDFLEIDAKVDYDAEQRSVKQLFEDIGYPIYNPETD